MTTLEGDVVIIGGGLHGCAAAFFLARRGLKAIVLEQARVGEHASGRSAGGVRRLQRDPAEIPLSILSMALWRQLNGLLSDDGGFRVASQVQIAETVAELAMLEARAQSTRQLGYTHEELIDRAELMRLLPALRSGAGIGGLVCRDDGFATPYRTTLAFAAGARVLGASVLEGARVVGVDRTQGRWSLRCADGRGVHAPKLLNAAGAWGHRVAAALGDPVPLRFAAYMMTLTSAVGPFVTPVVLLAGRPLSFKQLDNGMVMIGGGFAGWGDLDTGEVRVDVEALSYNVRTAFELFPALQDASIARSWCGLEGVFADGLPALGRSAASDAAFHAFGFCGHGFQLGPGSGAVMARLIADGVSEIALDAFRVDRFAAGA